MVYTDSDQLALYQAHAIKATQCLERDGCYWFNATRQAASFVGGILEEAGYEIITHNPPPVYEFAIYTVASFPHFDTIDKIAMLRQDLRDAGISEERLPVTL